MKMLHNKFVEFIPKKLEENILYVSVEYCTAAHLCVCGCGNKVITPLAPTSWKLTFDGKTVSLYPSIGNWNFDCESHYWIINNKVKHSGKWSRIEIENGRASDAEEKQNYYNENKQIEKITLPQRSKEPNLLKRFLSLFGL